MDHNDDQAQQDIHKGAVVTTSILGVTNNIVIWFKTHAIGGNSRLVL